MRSIIEKMFKDVIESAQYNEEVYSRYFSDQYMQHVDGNTLDYQGFLQHMRALMDVVAKAKVTIDHCVANEKAVCTVHRVEVWKKDGRHLEVKVIAYFEFKDGKIVLCDELTKLLKGGKEDQDIGSKR